MFGDPASDPIPHVIFEVGFSETYDDLVLDAKQWLQRPRGRAKLVIIINIEEDKGSVLVHQKTSQSKSGVKSFIAEFNMMLQGSRFKRLMSWEQPSGDCQGTGMMHLAYEQSTDDLLVAIAGGV